MSVIEQENKKAFLYSGFFLIATGISIHVLGYIGHNYSGSFLGLSFAVLSTACMLFIRFDRLFVAKMLWGTGTPVLILLTPFIFPIEKTSSIFSLGYALIGSSLFVMYSFQTPTQRWGMWVCILFYFIAIIAYDRIVVHNSIPGLDYTFITINYGHFKGTQLLHFGSLVFLMLLVQRNKTSIEQKLAEQILRLKTFTQELLDFSKEEKPNSGIITESLKEIAVFVAQNMGISRVSIWEYDEAGESIVPVVCFDAGRNLFIDEQALYRKDAPVYFTHLLNENVIKTNNTWGDEKTKEFLDSYLIPNNIKSMLDFPFFIDGNFKGILCCEEQRHIKDWDEIDVFFAQSISKYISIAYYCAIREQQFEMIEAGAEQLKIQNELLSIVNRNLSGVNEELVTDIEWKNKNIEQLRSFLNDLSFRNSHHLRGPLSRILGLVSMYKVDTNPENRELFIEYISRSADEMDDMIREISQVISKRK